MNLESLEAPYLQFANALLDCMAVRAAKEGIPALPTTRFEFTDDQGMRTISNEPHLQRLAHRCLYSSPTLMELNDQSIAAHWNAGLFRSPPVPKYYGSSEVCETLEEAKGQISEALLQPITDALISAGSFPVSREALLEQYRRARTSWTAPFYQIRELVPLVNFTSDVPRAVPISARFSLNHFGSDAKSEALASLGMPFSASLQEGTALTQAQFTLSRVVERPKATQTFEAELTELMETATEIANIVTALRLLKVGSVGAPMLYQLGDGILPWGNVRIGRGVGAYPRFASDAYSLSKQDMPSLRRLFESLRSLKPQETSAGLDVALRYFNQSYSRTSQEDRLVDLAIVVESSLLYGMRDELSYRASLLGAAMLAPTRSAMETSKLIKSLYEARSMIVHNGKTLAGMKKSDQFCDQCEEVIRAILRTYVEQLARVDAGTHSVESLNADLGRDLIENLRPPWKRRRRHSN